MNLTNITSFHQSNKHITKSERFIPVKPAHIAEVLTAHNFELVHLKSGKSRAAHTADFQTTVARYRSRQDTGIGGLNFDIIFKVPHIYGSIVGVLGLFRGVCANQLNVGAHFNSVKVKHIGDPLAVIDETVIQLVNQQNKLVETVQRMSNIILTDEQKNSLALEACATRLSNVNNLLAFDHKSVLTARRSADTANDLFTVYNTVQENIIRHGVKYISKDNETGKLRNGTARRIDEAGVSAVELNGKLFDVASKYLTA